MAEDTMIFSLKIEGLASEATVKKLADDVDRLSEATKNLQATDEELLKQKQLNEQQIAKNTEAVNKSRQAIEAEDGSIKKLRESNKKLTEERNATTTKTEEGRAKIAQLNKQLDENNKTIKDNIDATTKQRMSMDRTITNLDKLAPGLTGAARGFGEMTKASLAFIATPIGAIIAAIGLALGALMSYFKGSEEGQNKLNRIMAIGGQVIEKVTDAVEFLGSAIFDGLGKAFEFLGGLIEDTADFLGINTQAVKDYFNEISARANEIADLQEKMNSQERELIVQRAKVAKEATQLRLEADALEGKARLDKVNQAIALEKGLLDKELEFAKSKLRQAEINAEEDPTIEKKKLLAEATAELLNKEAEFNQGIRKLNKERIELMQEEYEEKKRIAEQEQSDAFIRSEQRMQALELELQKRNAAIASSDAFIKSSNLSVEIDIKASIGRVAKVRETQRKTEEANAKADLAMKRAVIEMETNAKFAAANASLDFAKVIFGKNKKIAIAETILNTVQGIVRAVKDYPFPYSLIVGALVGAMGTAQTAKIAGIGGFATGGLTGTKVNPSMGTPIRRSNGDNLLATVKTGEVILNEQQQAKLGGATTFKSIGVPGFATGGSTGGNTGSSFSLPSFNQQTSLNEMSRNMERLAEEFSKMQIVLPVDNLAVVQGRVKEVESKATLL